MSSRKNMCKEHVPLTPQDLELNQNKLPNKAANMFLELARQSKTPTLDNILRNHEEMWVERCQGLSVSPAQDLMVWILSRRTRTLMRCVMSPASLKTFISPDDTGLSDHGGLRLYGHGQRAPACLSRRRRRGRLPLSWGWAVKCDTTRRGARGLGKVAEFQRYMGTR